MVKIQYRHTITIKGEHLKDFIWFFKNSFRYMKGNSRVWILINIPYKFYIFKRGMEGLTTLEFELSKIIDNIDTASDIAKDNDKRYRELIKRQIKEFRKLISSDGYVMKKNK